MTPVDERGASARIATLAQAARFGDEEALGKLVTELSPMLWQVARAAGLDRSDAEDVLQTVWLRLLDHLDGIRTSGAFTSWLVVTTRRESWRVRAAGRKVRPAADDWLAELPGSEPGCDEQLILAEQHHALRVALSKLPDRCQELLRIVAFVPRPDYAAVAAKLGMAVGSVGPTRGRCLAKLRALLASAEGNS